MTSEDLPFKTLFENIELLPQKGAFGKVFRCEKNSTLTIVKLIDTAIVDEDSESTEMIERFQKEISILKEMEHPNIVRILRYNDKEPPFWYEMEYADIGDLEETMFYYSRDAITIKNIFVEVCLGVKYLHDNNIIHRDLKPRNILLFSKNNKPSVSAYYNMTAKVADFGIVLTNFKRLTESGVPLGTMDYMAPEQKDNAKYVDKSADIYSLGKILLEMWTGNTDSSFVDEVPEVFLQIIKKATRYESDQRYQSIDEIFNDLQNISLDECFQLGYIHPGREFENIINHIYYPSKEVTPNLLQQLAALFERAKDSDPGFVAVNTSKLPIDMIKDIDCQKPSYLTRLLVRFIKAIDSNYDKSFWGEPPEDFVRFLGNTYMVISSEENKKICVDKICWYAQEKSNLYAKNGVVHIIKKAVTPIDKKIICNVIKQPKNKYLYEWLVSYSELSIEEKRWLLM